MRSKRGVEYLNGAAKRRLDVLGGVGVAAALTPAVIPVAALAAIDNRSLNPFFSQERVGNHGETLPVNKFRSLRKERTQGELKHYGTFDPRATVIGQFLRNYGLDEIPQLLTVIRGDMSLVGPRVSSRTIMEEMEDRLPRLFDEWHEAYQSTKPGLISPSRLYARHRGINDEVLTKVMKMEIDYINHATLINDLRILGATPLKLLRTRGIEIDTALTVVPPVESSF